MNQPKVTVLVSAHNERENLVALIPLLLTQDYPCFEIIIVLDRGDDGSENLKELFQHDKLRFVEISEVPEGIHPKKFAIQTGVSRSRGEWMLLTDADCLPKPTWVGEMVGLMSGEIVIGLSPYQKHSGFLNQLIQYETFQTALHFVSSAATGKPYMALGRNLAYKKALFEEAGGFGDSRGVTGGDDDLLIQRMISSDNFTLALSPGSRVDSIPKTTWAGYWKQKNRHLSVGKFYPSAVMKSETFRWFLHIGMWIAFIPALLTNPLISALILAFTILIKAISINIVADRLEKRFNHLWLPFVDLAYAVLIPVIGARSLLVKNIKWN